MLCQVSGPFHLLFLFVECPAFPSVHLTKSCPSLQGQRLCDGRGAASWTLSAHCSAPFCCFAESGSALPLAQLEAAWWGTRLHVGAGQCLYWLHSLLLILLSSFAPFSLAELGTLLLLVTSLPATWCGRGALWTLLPSPFCSWPLRAISCATLTPGSNSWNTQPGHRPNSTPAWEGSSDKSLDILPGRNCSFIHLSSVPMIVSGPWRCSVNGGWVNA